jgi:Tol biopolymer transport system component
MKRSCLMKYFWSVTLAVLVAAALALGACGSDTPASTSSSAAPSQAAASPSVASSATPLPAATVAGTFAITKINEQAYGEIWLVNGDGTGLRRLASRVDYDLAGPAWSPDGARIAYHRSEKRSVHTEDYTIWVMNADGSGQQRLTEGQVRGLWPTWSPDGAQIAFRGTSLHAQNGISVIDADGGGLGQATKVESDDVPDWSPSEKVLFIRGGADVFSVNPDGSALTRLTKDASATEVALSPDGKTLAVYDALADSIVLLPVDGAGPSVTLVDQVAARGYVPQRYGAAYGVALTWSPDGQAVAFSTNGNEMNSGSALYVVNVDGSGLSVVPNTGMIWEADWRPE